MRAPAWLVVATTVVVFHGLLMLAFVARGHSAIDFARVSPSWVNGSRRSSVIVPSRFGFTRQSAGHGASQLGYDGQYYLFMALDPANARYYLDDPSYRWSRPLYPIASRLIAVGDPSVIPVVMLLVNLLAAGVGTGVVARILSRKRESPWFALLYGLAPGMALGVHRDLTEPLSFALCVLGVSWVERGPPDPRGREPNSRMSACVIAGTLFGLAGLTRAPSVTFPLVYGLARAWRDRASSGVRRWLPAGAILFLGIVPVIAWTIVVKAWLGSWPTGSEGTQAFPFAFLVDQPFGISRQLPELLAVFLPSVLWIGVCVALRRRLSAELACAVVSALAFVALGPDFTGFPASGRAALTASVPMLLALPQIRRAPRTVKIAYFVACALFMAALPGAVVVDLFNLSSH